MRAPAHSWYFLKYNIFTYLYLLKHICAYQCGDNVNKQYWSNLRSNIFLEMLL